MALTVQQERNYNYLQGILTREPWRVRPEQNKPRARTHRFEEAFKRSELWMMHQWIEVSVRWLRADNILMPKPSTT